jgi:hypothetical protein
VAGLPRKKKPTHQSFESKNEHGQFMKLTINMLESPAWQALSVYEQALYVAIRAKYKRSNKTGQDNSMDLSFTYKEGRQLMSPERFTKAIDKLIETGLVDLVNHRPQVREATIYGLSARWHDYGRPEFKEQKRVKSKRGKSGK